MLGKETKLSKEIEQMVDVGKSSEGKKRRWDVMQSTHREPDTSSRGVLEVMARNALGFLQVQTESSGREKIRESFRSIAEEYRREGNSRSTAPDLRSMTEREIMLEVLRHSDWSDKLVEVLRHSDWSDKLLKEGVEVNKRTFELISQMLKGIDPSKPSDYNPAVRNFHETLDKFNDKDVAVLRVELVGLRGGGFYNYDENAKEYYSRIMTLRDPEGNDHHFEKADWNGHIAGITTLHIDRYWKRDAVEWWAQQGTSNPTDRQIASYKENYGYNKGKVLTPQEVYRLQEGQSLHGWTCTRFTRVSLPIKVYYTDKGAEIDALDFSAFRDPNLTYNCFSEFINNEGWLVGEKLKEGQYEETQIRTILDDNEYYQPHKGQEGDLVAYHINDGSTWPNPRIADGSIAHIATVLEEDEHGNLIAGSKPGDDEDETHYVHDEQYVRRWGTPFIYRTNRKDGHSLLTVRPHGTAV